MKPRSDLDPRDLPFVEGAHSRYPVVDLSQVPEEQWAEALSHFPRETYQQAANTVDFARVGRALEAAGEAELMRLEISHRRRVRPETTWFAAALPTPDAGRPASRRRRQVNFRLRSEQYDQLAQAAERMDMRPTALASLLVIRGVDQILREAERG